MLKFKRIPRNYFKIGLAMAIAPLLAGLAFFAMVYFGLWGSIPNKKQLSDLGYQRASEIYSADSVLIGKYFLYDRQPIAYDQFPEHLLQALISTEDERFYGHSGIDMKSLFRVAFKSVLLQDQSSGGGSTLTQQLAKNRYPRSERPKAPLIVNKVKEMIMARRLERLYSKEEILEHYLNTVPFGDNALGIESASLRFFNTTAKTLKIEEAAVLVGMLKATYTYNPRIYPEKSLKRRNEVLERMQRNGHLRPGQKDSLCAIPLKIRYTNYDPNQGLAPYFREVVRKQLLQWQKESNQGTEFSIYTSGLKIYTTLNYQMQVLAEKAMKKHMARLQKDFEKSYGRGAPWINNQKLLRKEAQKLKSYQKLEALGLTQNQIWDSLSQKKSMALTDWSSTKTVEASTIDSLKHYLKFLNVGSLGLDPQTGAVKTWIGGIDYAHFKYDHVAQSKRQVGSTFKPIVYTAALENGMRPCQHISAREVEYKNLKNWSPGNSGKKDEAYLNYSMEEALSNSINTVTVKVLEETGLSKVLQQAQKMGIEEKLPEEPSIALGTGSMSITELAKAYTTYVNDGRPVHPYMITAITTANDSVLTRFNPSIPTEERAFSEETEQMILRMMQATTDRGTASRLRNTYGLQNAIASKTGTTQNNKDAWFVAVMPKLVHVSWVGLENHEIGFKTTQLGQGANAALPLFALLLRDMNDDKQFNDITKARFRPPSPEIQKKLDCPPIKKDGFLKRLFTNPKKKKKRRFKK